MEHIVKIGVLREFTDHATFDNDDALKRDTESKWHGLNIFDL